ncbi:hypothetical protein Pan44_39860 [Caulifigura coniformis]|uniref:Uncharacterized protein n=1 Tax=Caulifigura coniformis TaxID=2527983 RepID=A0A517SII0_9PLAN|nr:hypothetical protein [Caulifigura coniformis]QDT55938.1 hypothetical protein Pan44_39860 [Caulifigura coniformis]
MSHSAISTADHDALLEELGEDTVAQMLAMVGMTDEEIAQEMRNLAARGEPGTVKQLVRQRALRQHRIKTNLDSVLNSIEDRGFTTRLTRDSLERIASAGFRGKNLALAIVATDIACDEHPLTLRGLFYRVVSAGFLPSTDKEHYSRMGRVMTRLRETGVVPFEWLVDNVRSSQKPSSWTGIPEFLDTVQRAYRKDFWAELPEYVHVIVEKDAMAGVVSPITEEFDVTLSPIRGYASLSFAHEIASTWNRIEKPIDVYYLGDFDPSGFDLERDIRSKLSTYCHHAFRWHRLGVNAADFDDFDLLKLEPKKSDKRYRAFIEAHGSAAAELDALPAPEIRDRVRAAIERHIPPEQWERLQTIELEERSLFRATLGRLRAGHHPSSDEEA